MCGRWVSLCIAAAVFELPCGSILRAEGVPVDLVVRVYDQRGGLRADSQQALAVAADIFRDALIGIEWRVCIEPVPDNTCDVPLARGERTVRLLRSTDARRGSAGDALGVTLMEPGIWLHALVFVDRVARQSSKAGGNLQLLLGRTIAHEIGHLVLGDPSHGTEGLMRAVWNDRLLTLSQPSDWQFTPSQAAAMRARLQVR